MSGGKHADFHAGDRTELMVQFVLGTVAFTTPVPRQEDIGHDFLCVLAEPRGKMLWAGPSFAVQAKSNTRPILYKKPHQLRWIREQENPFFIAVGDKKSRQVRFYATHQRLNAFLHRAARRVVLKFSTPPRGKGQVVTAADESLQTIYLGPPVASVGLADAMRPDCADNLRDVLRAWILIDRENIANRHAGMYWVVTPSGYRTDDVPRSDLPLDVRMYWNAKNLELCQCNFTRAAAALRLTIEAASPRNKTERRDMVAPLDEVLTAFSHAVDPGAVQALKKHCGILVPPSVPPRSR